MMITTYAVSAACLLGAAAFDRLVLRQNKIDLQGVTSAGLDEEGKFFQFALTFNIRRRLVRSELKYTVRNKKQPKTVIQGKTRILDFSDIGFNQEFLLIKNDLLTPGEWVIDVEATSLVSRVNPLFSIYPITSRLRKEVDISL